MLELSVHLHGEPNFCPFWGGGEEGRRGVKPSQTQAGRPVAHGR